MHIKKNLTDIFLWISLTLSLVYLYMWTILIEPYPDYNFLFFNVLTCAAAFIFLGLNRRCGISSAVNSFAILFLCITPLIGRITETTYWDAGKGVLKNYPAAQIIVLVSLVVFNLIYQRLSGRHTERSDRYRLNISTLIMISYGSLAAIAYMNNFSIVSMAVRGGDLKIETGLSTTSHLIYTMYIFTMPAICFCVYAIYGSRRLVTLVILAVPMLIGNAPTSAARFQVATIYIAAAITMFPSLRTSNIRIPALIILGIVVIFPTLDQFRYYSGEIPEIRFIGPNDVSQGHFDTFQSIAGAIDIPITFGWQLLGVVLFWVPRSIWPGKPVGSSVEYAQSSNLSFDNISMNFLAEGIINFGIFGSIIFAALAAVVSAHFDSSKGRPPPASRAVMSAFMIGLSVFIFRGDMLSSVAYTTGIYLSIITVTRLTVIRTE